MLLKLEGGKDSDWPIKRRRTQFIKSWLQKLDFIKKKKDGEQLKYPELMRFGLIFFNECVQLETCDLTNLLQVSTYNHPASFPLLLGSSTLHCKLQ